MFSQLYFIFESMYKKVTLPQRMQFDALNLEFLNSSQIYFDLIYPLDCTIAEEI